MGAAGGTSGNWSHQDFPTSHQLSEEHMHVDFWGWQGKTAPTASVASPLAPKYICHSWVLATSSSKITWGPLDPPGQAMGCRDAAGHCWAAGHVGQLFAFLRGAFALAITAQRRSSSWREIFYKSKYVGETGKHLTAASCSQRSQPPAATPAAQRQKRRAAASFPREHRFIDVRALFCLFSLFPLFPEYADRAIFHLIFAIWRFICTHFLLFGTSQLASSTPLYLNICFQ